MIPLGNDFKHPITKTMWVDEDRSVKELPLNVVATNLYGEVATPSKEAMTHNMYVADDEGEEHLVDTMVGEPSEFPPILGPVVITDIEEDGI